MKLILDRLGLILAGLACGAFCLWFFNVVGQDSLFVIFGILYVSQMFDNMRLRKKLKELGHPDDFRSRLERHRQEQRK